MNNEKKRDMRPAKLHSLEAFTLPSMYTQSHTLIHSLGEVLKDILTLYDKRYSLFSVVLLLIFPLLMKLVP